MIVIHAYMKVNPKERESFLELAKQVITHSKAEEGNNSYHLYEDTEHANTFVMLEEWKDIKATEIHRETEHFQNFIKEVPKLLLEPMRADRYEIKQKLN